MFAIIDVETTGLSTKSEKITDNKDTHNIIQSFLNHHPMDLLIL
jgi:uncharacterized protein YprB with RNaseH-like and TPR domain